MLPHRLLIRFIIGIIAVAITASAAAARQRSDDFGTLSIQVRPPDAEVFIDGERWTGSEENAPLQVQLTPGTHRVEIRSAGRQAFSRTVTIRSGETTPLNVSLVQAESEHPPASSPSSSAAAPAPSRSSESGIHVSPTEDGFMIAPDYRVTEINHETAQFVGAYGGYVFDGQFLVGGGGYWQTQSIQGERIAYAGPVVEWRAFRSKTFGLNFHGLVGGGWRDLDDSYFARFDRPGIDRRALPPERFRTLLYGFHNDPFFVAEPEAQFVVRLGSSVRVQAGAGYRATSVDSLSGASGSVSVQFGR